MPNISPNYKRIEVHLDKSDQAAVCKLIRTYTKIDPLIGSRSPNQTDVIRRALQVLVQHTESIKKSPEDSVLEIVGMAKVMLDRRQPAMHKWRKRKRANNKAA